MVGQISVDSSYCLHLLIGLGCIEVEHGGRLTAMVCVTPLMVVEGDQASIADLGV